MVKLLQCECGLLLRGETDEELLTRAEAHLLRDHGDLAGGPSREDFLAMAVEQETGPHYAPSPGSASG